MTPRAWPLICILKFLRIFHLLHLLGKNRVRYFEKIWIIKLEIDFNKYHNNEKSSKNSEKIIEILKLQKWKKSEKLKKKPGKMKKHKKWKIIEKKNFLGNWKNDFKNVQMMKVYWVVRRNVPLFWQQAATATTNDGPVALNPLTHRPTEKITCLGRRTERSQVVEVKYLNCLNCCLTVAWLVEIQNLLSDIKSQQQFLYCNLQLVQP